MKNINIAIAIIMLCLNTKAQHCSETINTISTDWRNNQSANSWNWTLGGMVYPVYLTDNQDQPSRNIEMPWSCLTCATLPESHQANASGYLFRGGLSQQDIYPEDGWELLYKDFGTANTAPGNNTGHGVATPYFMLYNRINGKMKIFVALFGPRGQDAGMIRIGFSIRDPDITDDRRHNNSQAQRALFNYNEPIAKTVLEFNPYGEFKAMNQVLEFPSGQTSDLRYQWMVAEIITSYDPCTCENPIGVDNNKISVIEMQTMLINDASINAKIDGKSTQNVIASGTTVPQDNDGFISMAKAAGKAAQKGWKDWKSAKKTANSIIDFGNDALAKHLARRFYYDELLDDEIELTPSEARQQMRDFLGSTDAWKQGLGVKKPDEVEFGKFLKGAKGVASALPYVGAAIGIIDFLANGGDKTETPKVGPITFDVNLTLAGTITETSPINSPYCYTPGSSTPSNAPDYLKPIYNNTLGVFNILDLPELEYAEIIPSVTNRSHEILKQTSNMFDEDNQCELSYRNDHNLDGAREMKFRQYKPKTNLKYVLNPASNLEVVSIDAAIILEYKNTDKLFIEKPNALSNSVAMPYHSKITTPEENDKMYEWVRPDNLHGNWFGDGKILYNLVGQQVDLIKEFETESALFKRYKNITETSNLDLEFISSGYPNADSSFIRYRTRYFPITCFTEANFTLLDAPNLPKLYCKLYIKLKRTDVTNSEPITFIITYDMNSKLSTATKNSSVSGSYISEVRGDKYFRDEKCCYKCGSELFIYVMNMSDYTFHKDFSLTNVPFSPTQYSPVNYSYQNEQILTLRGKLTIPENSVIPANSIIQAAGLITIEKNVTIGAGSLIISGSKIDVQTPNIFWPDVTLKIKPINEIIYSCTSSDFASLHNSESEITQFCSKNVYKNIVYQSSKQRKEISPKPKYINTESCKIYPNPNTGIFNVEIPKNNSLANLILTDLAGKIILSRTLAAGQTTAKLETTGLANGIYMMIIKTDENQVTKKVIINNP